jgi:hypothetical protein
MNKKLLIIILSTGLSILLLVLIGYYLYIANGTTNTNEKPSIFRSFFPFGKNDLTQPNSTTTNPGLGEETPSTLSNFTSKLRMISLEPVAGAGLLDTKAGTVLRYMERATGHIFEVELFSPKNTRISNKTIPFVYNAVWDNKNNSLVTQYLEDDDQTIDVYLMSLKQVATTTESTVSALLLSGNITDVSVYGGNVFYLDEGNQSSSGYISGLDGTKRKLIWNSPLSQLLSQFVNPKTIALTTKPAVGINGYLYFVDTTSGAIQKIIGDIPGLSTLVSEDATKILYLEEADEVSFHLFDAKSRVSDRLSPVTFPEKCIWSKKNKNIVYCAVPQTVLNNNSLTQWYKGNASFTDDIWKYDTKNNTASIIENLTEESGESIDVIKPLLSENERYLVFINKRDNSLWSLDLTQ